MKTCDSYGYTYDGGCYCQDHLPVNEDDPGVYPIFADSAWNNYPSCVICGKVFNYVSLTDHCLECEACGVLAGLEYGFSRVKFYTHHLVRFRERNICSACLKSWRRQEARRNAPVSWREFVRGEKVPIEMIK